MANQALINAAQRMYTAKAQQTDITPITDAVSSSVANITKAVQEKKAEQEERSEKAIEPFKNILLENPDARPQLQAELDKLQDQYFQNIKTSEKLFGNKDEKKQAIDDNNNISYVLRAYQKDLESVDLNMVAPSNPSEFNSIGEQVDGVGMKDVSLANRLIFKSGKDDAGKDITGIYTKNHKGEEVRLSDYKGQSQINTEGFDRLVETRQNAINVAKKGGDWESEAAPRLQKNLSELMLDKNWGSMLFDDLDGYNWATQQMEQEGVDDKEAFKIKVKANPDFYKKEYVNDVLAAYKLDFDEAKRNVEIKDEYSEESIKDVDLAIKNINDGLPISLSSITGRNEDKYTNIIPDPEDKDKYVYATNKAVLEGYPKLSIQDLAKLLNVPLARFTGFKDEEKDPLNPFN